MAVGERRARGGGGGGGGVGERAGGGGVGCRGLVAVGSMERTWRIFFPPYHSRCLFMGGEAERVCSGEGGCS